MGHTLIRLSFPTFCLKLFQSVSHLITYNQPFLFWLLAFYWINSSATVNNWKNIWIFNTFKGSSSSSRSSKFSMPLRMLGEKKYYIGMFFKVDWWEMQQQLYSFLPRLTGTRLSSTAGSMGCTLLVLTLWRNRRTWSIFSSDLGRNGWGAFLDQRDWPSGGGKVRSQFLCFECSSNVKMYNFSRLISASSGCPLESQ